MSDYILYLIAEEKEECTGTFDLARHKLTEIPKEIEELTHLTTLNFRYNNISDISILENLTNLTTLDLSSNQILDISFLENLTNLTTLYLGNNQISNYSFLENLTNLTSLGIYSSQISDYSFLEKLTNLTTLDLSYSQILDCSFLEKLPKLIKLDVSGSQISNYNFLENLTNLTTLKFGSSEISDYSFLKKLINLTTLNLSLSDVSDCIFLEKLTKLTTLNLHRNKVSNIQALETLTNLTTLDLSYNKISNIQALKNLANLIELNLSYNQISDIQVLEKKVNTNIKRLDLYRNKIKDLKPLLPLIKKGIPLKCELFVDGICIENNPLENPPIEIIKQGSEAIIEYFEIIEKKSIIELYEAKMIILGDTNVGKSSLLRKVIDNNAYLPQEGEMIKEVDVHKCFFPVLEEQDFRINLWDFGKQAIHHAMYKFFLTKRSLYVLVDSVQADSTQTNNTRLKHWLETIKSFGGESPIVIIQNEHDNRSHKLNLKTIQADFPNVKGCYTTDLRTGHNLIETKKALEFHIQQLPHIGVKLPEAWLNIRYAIEDLEYSGTAVISKQKYFDICKKNNISEESTALTLSQYLHDLGVFFHFQDDDLLSEIIILKREWVTDAVSKILNAEIIKRKEGRFTKEDFKMILNDKRYEGMHEKLIRLMERFKFCYPSSNVKGSYLIP